MLSRRIHCDISIKHSKEDLFIHAQSTLEFSSNKARQKKKAKGAIKSNIANEKALEKLL